MEGMWDTLGEAPDEDPDHTTREASMSQQESRQERIALKRARVLSEAYLQEQRDELNRLGWSSDLVWVDDEASVRAARLLQEGGGGGGKDRRGRLTSSSKSSKQRAAVRGGGRGAAYAHAAAAADEDGIDERPGPEGYLDAIDTFKRTQQVGIPRTRSFERRKERMALVRSAAARLLSTSGYSRHGPALSTDSMQDRNTPTPPPLPQQPSMTTATTNPLPAVENRPASSPRSRKAMTSTSSSLPAPRRRFELRPDGTKLKSSSSQAPSSAASLPAAEQVQEVQQHPPQIEALHEAQQKIFKALGISEIDHNNGTSSSSLSSLGDARPAGWRDAVLDAQRQRDQVLDSLLARYRNAAAPSSARRAE